MFWGVAMYACGANVALRCVSGRLNGIKKARRKGANKPAGVSLCGSWRSERENYNVACVGCTE